MYMFFLILVISLPILFLLEDSLSERFRRSIKYILFLWMIAFFASIAYAMLYFVGIGSIMLLLSPIIIRGFFQYFRRTKYVDALDISINNIIDGFWKRMGWGGVITLGAIALFIYFDIGIIGPYIAFVLFLVFLLNIMNQINSKLGLLFALSSIFALLASDPEVKYNVSFLICGISLFLVVIPLVVFKPFENNMIVHVLAFVAFIVLTQILRPYNDIFLSTVPLSIYSFLITTSVLLFVASMNFKLKPSALSHYLYPLGYCFLVVFILWGMKINLQITSRDFELVMMNSLKYLLIFGVVWLFARCLGPILINLKSYDFKGEVSDYQRYQTFFSLWLSDTFGKYLFRLFFGEENYKLSMIVSVVLLSFFSVSSFLISHAIQPQEGSFVESLIKDGASTKFAFVLLGSLKVISGITSIRVWLKQKRGIDRERAGSSTNDIFWGIVLILLPYTFDLYYLDWGVWKLVVFGVIIGFLYNFWVLLGVLSDELSAQKKKLSFESTKKMLVFLLIYFALVISLFVSEASHLLDLSYSMELSIYIFCFGAGAFVAKNEPASSQPIFLRNTYWFLNKFSHPLLELFVLMYALFNHKEMVPFAIFLVTYSIYSRMKKVALSKKR